MYSLIQVTYNQTCNPVLRCCSPVCGADDLHRATEQFDQLVAIECTDGEQPVFSEFNSTGNGLAPEKEAVITHKNGEVVLVALFKV